MRKMVVVGAAVLLFAPATPARAEVQLQIQDGLVSLRATNATVREILATWARVGQTRVVNGDRVPGGPLTIQLDNVAEDEALEVILRSVAGYVTAPRATAVASASRFDRILVMPTSAPVRAAASQPPTFVPPPNPQFQMPPFQPPVVDDDGDVEDADDEEPSPNVVLPTPRGPVFNTFPQPQRAAPSPRAPVATPYLGQMPEGGQIPAGVAVPGMVVPAPEPSGLEPQIIEPQEP
jgi:hypothetical protein